jgi:hypothetical protein
MLGMSQLETGLSLALVGVIASCVLVLTAMAARSRGILKRARRARGERYHPRPQNPLPRADSAPDHRRSPRVASPSSPPPTTPTPPSSAAARLAEPVPASRDLPGGPSAP